jgi:hypothetical protein
LLIDRFGYSRYLEIGIRNPNDNFNRIKATTKDGVDPKGKCNYPMTSDAFFEQLDKEKRYDIVFIDGLHEAYQVTKDIFNAAAHLAPNGTIVMHDCNPPDEWHQRPVSEYKFSQPWNGTCWKSYAHHRLHNPRMAMWCVDTDWGVGVIRKGSQTCFDVSLDVKGMRAEELPYSLLEENRQDLLNLVAPAEFVSLLKTDMAKS